MHMWHPCLPPSGAVWQGVVWNPQKGVAFSPSLATMRKLAYSLTSLYCCQWAFSNWPQASSYTSTMTSPSWKTGSTFVAPQWCGSFPSLSFGAIKHLSGISSSLWKMFKSLKKKPEKAKEAIDFKLKFHATRVCYVCVCQSVFLWASLLWCMPGYFWFRLCTLECSYGICLSVRAVSLVCLH